MVDSGSQCCVIRRRAVQHLMTDENHSTGYLVTFDNTRAPIAGIIALTVRYKDSVVNLPRVRVVEDMVHDMILGEDWLLASGFFVGSDGERLVVVRLPPGAASPFQNSNPAARNENEERQEEIEHVQEIDESPQVEVQALNSPTKPHVHFFIEEAAQEPDIQIMSAIFLEESMPDSEYARVMDKAIIPPGALSFVNIGAPKDKSTSYKIEKAFSSKPKQEWIVPDCLIASNGGDLRIPVVNLSKTSLQWQKGQEIARLTPFPDIQSPSHPPESDLTCSVVTKECTQKEQLDFTQQLSLGDNLTDKERADLIELLNRYSSCFAPGGTLGEIKGVYHHIETGNALLISTAPRRVSPGERRVIAEQVNSMLTRGIIEPSSSPWAAAVVIVPKKDGSPRFCVDYRALNDVTKKDVYPLPRADDLLLQISGAVMFSAMDLKDGFWQIPLLPEHKEKTAFVTPEGLYQFRRLPFGLCNSPSTFMRVVDRVLVGLKWTHCLAYLDDVLVFGNTAEQHQERLELVLIALESAGLKLHPGKCRFGVESVIYLGHIIDKNGVRPSPDKMIAVRHFPVPSDVSSLRSYLGLISFFRRFVAGFARIAFPLHQLLKKSVIWDWNEERNDAFNQLKQALLNAPTLAHDGETDRLILRTDAAKRGLGAMLSVKRDGKEWPVTFISRRTTKAEENYHSNELECLALVWALGKLRHHLYGRPFSVLTDNSALSWLRSKKDIGGKLARWILALQEYDFDIGHIKGIQNSAADALSRNPVGEAEETDPTERMICSLMAPPFQHEEIAVLQQGDVSLREIILKIRDGIAGEDSPFMIHRNALYRKNTGPGKEYLLVIPSILRRDVVHACHDMPTGGHMGQTKTLHRVNQRYW